MLSVFTLEVCLSQQSNSLDTIQAACSVSVPAGDDFKDGISQSIAILREHGVMLDTNATRHAAILGVLSAVDPKARILSTGDVMRIEAELDGRPEGTGIQRESFDRVEKWPRGICYARFNGFFRGTTGETCRKLSGATNGCSGMILDLRKAGGMDLGLVESLGSMFVHGGSGLFMVCSQNGTELERHVSSGGERFRIPVVVLIDENTSGAPELFAAVVRGTAGVLLMGRGTNGDAKLREGVALPDGDIAYFGTRRVVPLQGSHYDPGRVEPDIVVHDRDIASQTNAIARVEIVQSGGNPRQTMDDLSEMTKGDFTLERAVDVLICAMALGEEYSE